jgi:RNA polymerase sigma-70 factor (ECF subfamily)
VSQTVTFHAEDRDLVERMLGGEEAAFSSFVERYSKALYRFALARVDGDREQARETVQTAITKALQRLDSYRGEASLLTWLCACCRNEILMQRRRRSTGPLEVELDDDLRPAVGSAVARTPEDPESVLLRRETATRVHMTLDLLLPRYAQALEWKYVDRLPVDEIATRLGLKLKAAESLLVRAREAFRASHARVWSAAGTGAAERQREDEPRERARSEA